MERDAVHKALMSLLRQDVKGNLHVKNCLWSYHLFCFLLFLFLVCAWVNLVVLLMQLL